MLKKQSIQTKIISKKIEEVIRELLDWSKSNNHNTLLTELQLIAMKYDQFVESRDQGDFSTELEKEEFERIQLALTRLVDDISS